MLCVHLLVEAVVFPQNGGDLLRGPAQYDSLNTVEGSKVLRVRKKYPSFLHLVFVRYIV